MTKKKIYLGKIISTHGVKGLLKVDFYNNDSLNFKKYLNKTYIDNMQLNLEKIFTKGKLTICKIARYENKEEVIKFVGKEIWVEENSLKKNANEYFHKDLIEAKVYDKNNQLLGIVSSVHNFGAGDLLELTGKFKYMIRFYDLKVEDINLEEKIIRLNENYEV